MMSPPGGRKAVKNYIEKVKTKLQKFIKNFE